MPSIQGGFVPIFGILCFIAVVPIVTGSKKAKLIGLFLILLAIVLLINDYFMGKKFEANLKEILNITNQMQWSVDTPTDLVRNIKQT